MKFGVYHAISIRAIEKPSLFGKRFTRIHRIHGWKFIEKDEFPHVLTSKTPDFQKNPSHKMDIRVDFDRNRNLHLLSIHPIILP